MGKQQGNQGAAPSYPFVGVHSGQVMTVLGPVPVEELGVTLTHEHILSDFGCNGPAPEEASRKHNFFLPVSITNLGQIRMAPILNRDNQMLGDVELAAEEVARFRNFGGRTIVEVTNLGVGRDPQGLQQVSRRSGVQIVMGSGFYIGASHSQLMRTMSSADIADRIVAELTEGVAGTGARPGIIGEVAIDQEFTSEEEKSLRGAAQAARRTQVPLSVHMVGNIPNEHPTRALDIIEEEGADLRHMVFCHVQLHSRSFEAQAALADRGVFLGYDGISCDFDWGKRGVGPSDEENAADIGRLIAAGYLHHILLSHDIHLKIMLTRYGGYGYAYILQRFVNRLRAHGVTGEQIRVLLEDNPRRLFSSRYRAGQV